MVASKISLLILFTAIVLVLGGIDFQGSKHSGYAHLNCSLGNRPVADTVEFLVDGISAYSIRLYNKTCYRTNSGNPCTLDECQCSVDGRHYYWVYEYKYNKFRAECKAKITANCFANAEILFTESNSSPRDFQADGCSVSRGSKEIASIPIMATSFILFCITWYTSPIRYPIVMYLLQVVISCVPLGSCEKAVSFTYTDLNGTLCMFCDVKNLHSGVELIDPRGLSYHCTAAIAHLAPGDCDKTLPGSPPFKMQQDILKNRTILTLYNDRLECENGIWQCKHGTNTGEQSNVTVSVSRPRVTIPTSNHSDKGVNHGPIAFFLMHFGVFVFLVLVTSFFVIKCTQYGTGLKQLKRWLCQNERSPCDTVTGKVIPPVTIVVYFILLFILLQFYPDYPGLVASAAVGVIYAAIFIWLFDSNKQTNGEDDSHADFSNPDQDIHHSPQLLEELQEN